MNIAEIAWIVVGGIAALAALVFAVKMLPELRRYLRMKKM